MLNRVLLEQTLAPFGVTVGEAAFARLDTYAQLLVETNKQFNLTAITESDDMTVKHFADCLALFGLVEFPENAYIIILHLYFCFHSALSTKIVNFNAVWIFTIMIF